MVCVDTAIARLTLLAVWLGMARSRHLESGQSAASESDDQACRSMWMARMNVVCVYPAQTTPCFKDRDQSALSAHIERRCCSGGCLRAEMHAFCCDYGPCLPACYPRVARRPPWAHAPRPHPEGRARARRGLSLEFGASGGDWADVDRRLAAQPRRFGLGERHLRSFTGVGRLVV